MQACVTRVSGDDVYIERNDGLTTKVNIGIFSKPDQDYVRKWERDNLLKNGAFEVRFSQKATDKTKFDNSRDEGIYEKTHNHQYQVTLTNTTSEDFSNVKVEYLAIKFEDALGANKRSEGEIRRLKGEGQITSLPARSEGSIMTNKMQIRETKLAPNYIYNDGGKRTSKDEMRGIWVKIYVDNKLVQEFSKPENLKRKEVW